jgi:predicted nucleic acid-binding protein
VRYLLDTTLLIDHAKGRHGAPGLVDRLFSEANDLLTCDVVVAESISGGDDDEVAVVASLVGALEYVSTHPEAARWAGRSRRTHGATGRRSLADAIIAGIATDLGATVVTRNPRDFERLGVRVLGYGDRPSERREVTTP